MTVLIRPLASQEDSEAFRSLNEQWLLQDFSMEAEDRRQLDDPIGAFVTPGGEILIAELGGSAVGCVAIAPTSGGAFELSKMAVAPEMRGRGLGRRLVQAAIGCASARGASSLFLGSSTKLPDAVHLYESLGFLHVSPEHLRLPYSRADVFMELVLGDPGAPAISSLGS